MQRAAAATMPTTIPVVLLLSRTTSDGPGNGFPSDTGGRAAQRSGALRYSGSLHASFIYGTAGCGWGGADGRR